MSQLFACSDEGLSVQARQMSGLLLKNALRFGRAYQTLSNETLDIVKENVLVCVADSEDLIRRTAGSVISTIVGFAGLKSWPQLLQILSQALSQEENQNAIHGAFAVLLNLCEDESAWQLDSPELDRPLNAFLPRWIQYFQHPQLKFRQDAIMCINNLLRNQAMDLPASFDVHAEAFLQVSVALILRVQIDDS